VKRADGPYGKGVVNDLFIPGLLPRAGIVGDADKSVANGGVVEMPRSDQTAGRVSSPVELLREPGPFRSGGTLRDQGDQRVDDLMGGSRPPGTARRRDDRCRTLGRSTRGRSRRLDDMSRSAQFPPKPFRQDGRVPGSALRTIDTL
jgi:hypothetical protein